MLFNNLMFTLKGKFGFYALPPVRSTQLFSVFHPVGKQLLFLTTTCNSYMCAPKVHLCLLYTLLLRLTPIDLFMSYTNIITVVFDKTVETRMGLFSVCGVYKSTNCL